MTPARIAQFAIGPVGAAILGIITLPVITWFFSQEDVGRIAMLQVAISLTTLVFSLGLDQSYVREFHEVDDKPSLLKKALLPGMALLLVVVTGIFLVDANVSEWIFGVSEPGLGRLALLAILAAFVSRFLSLVLRMNEQGLAYSMSQVLPRLLLLAIIGGYIAFDANKSLTNLVLAQVASVILVFFAFAWNTRGEWQPAISATIDSEHLRAMLKFGFPLILGSLAFWGLTATDKVFLRALSTYEQLGVYSVAVSFAAAASILQNIFSTVWAPTVYKWASKGEGLEQVHRVTRYVLLCVVLFFSLAGMFSWLVTYLLPESYDSVQWILISCLGYPLLYTLSETTVVGIGISRKSAYAMLAACVAFVFNFVANWYLVPRLGAAGAAVSTCTAFLLFFILRTEFAILLWKPLPRVTVYLYCVCLVAGAVLSTLYGARFQAPMVFFWMAVMGSSFFVFKKEFAEIKAFFGGMLSRSG